MKRLLLLCIFSLNGFAMMGCAVTPVSAVATSATATYADSQINQSVRDHYANRRFETKPSPSQKNCSKYQLIPDITCSPPNEPLNLLNDHYKIAPK